MCRHALLQEKEEEYLSRNLGLETISLNPDCNHQAIGHPKLHFTYTTLLKHFKVVKIIFGEVSWPSVFHSLGECPNQYNKESVSPSLYNLFKGNKFQQERLRPHSRRANSPVNRILPWQCERLRFKLLLQGKDLNQLPTLQVTVLPRYMWYNTDSPSSVQMTTFHFRHAVLWSCACLADRKQQNMNFETMVSEHQLEIKLWSIVLAMGQTPTFTQLCAC